MLNKPEKSRAKLNLPLIILIPSHSLSFIYILVSVIVLLLASKAVCAFETGTLRGKVVDGFGKPINSANITVVSNGSKTKTTSDATGVFSIDYNPGNLKLTFDKEGYVPLYVPLSLDEKTDLSVGDITLWKIPPT